MAPPFCELTAPGDRMTLFVFVSTTSAGTPFGNAQWIPVLQLVWTQLSFQMENT